MANRHKAPRLKNPEVQKLIDSGIGVRQVYRKIENAKRAQEGKPKFDDNRWKECAPGIHCFITRNEAVNY